MMKEIITYFFRKKKAGNNRELRAMHIINLIAIIVFIAGVSFFLIRKLM